MSLKEELLNTIRALPLAEQQALLNELSETIKRETHRINKAEAQAPMPEEIGGDIDADRVLGMWRNRFDDAETSSEIANRWRRKLWQR